MKIKKKIALEGKGLCEKLGIVPPMSIKHAKYSEDKLNIKVLLINKSKNDEQTVIEVEKNEFLRKLGIKGTLIGFGVPNGVFDQLSDNFSNIFDSERKLVIEYEQEM